MSKKNIPVFDETGVQVGVASKDSNVEFVYGKPSSGAGMRLTPDRPVEKIIVRGFDFYHQGDWHNLTKAIVDGDPIDFEKLDGQKVRITNGQSSAESKIYRNEYYLIDRPTGWYCMFGDAFRDAWKGSDGWTLWLDGEIPMRKQTADELPFGTSFKDSHGYEYVVVARNKVQALYGNHNVTPAENIVVNEIFGMYGQKESE